MAMVRRRFDSLKPENWPINPETRKPVAKLFVEGEPGLHLTREGWRHKYSWKGRERLCSHGPWPGTSAAKAIEKAKALRELVKQGIDPAVERKATRLAEEESKAYTFGAVAKAYLAHPRGKPWSARTRRKKEWFVKLLAALGDRPIGELRRADVMRELEKLEGRGRFETTHRVAQFAQAVFAYAAGKGWIRENPIESGFRGGVLASRPVKHHSAITDPKELAPLLMLLHAGPTTPRWHPNIGHALELLSYVFVRSSELTGAEWSEIDFNTATWTIPESRMKKKGRGVHIVPLSTQAVAILRKQHALTGGGKLCFPGPRGNGRAVSDTALRMALHEALWLHITADRAAKDIHSLHGFRTTATTLLAELGFPADLVELQMAHGEDNKVRAAYYRPEQSRLPERRAMMQRWADYLDELKAA